MSCVAAAVSTWKKFFLQKPDFSFEGRRPRKFTSEKFRKKTKMKKTPTFSFLFKARTRFPLPYFSFEGRRPGKFMLELSEETRKKTKMKKPAADPPPSPIWLFQKQSSVKTKKTCVFSVEEIHGADKFVDDLRSLLPDVPYRAILLYNSMIFRGVGVDKFTFPFVMKACMAISCVKKAKEIYGFAVKSGFRGDVYLDNGLMDMYMTCGALNDALKVFDKMRHKSIVMLEKLLRAWMNVARFNFSHGSHEYHQETLDNLKIAMQNTQILAAVLLDTKGPEIRTGLLKDAKPIQLTEGQEITITTDYTIKGDQETISMSYKKLPVDLKPRNTILCADGTITFSVLSCDPTAGTVRCRCENTTMLGERKNVSLPDVVVDLPTLTDKDKEDILAWGVPNNIDMIALSFVPKGVCWYQNTDPRRAWGNVVVLCSRHRRCMVSKGAYWCMWLSITECG